MTAMSNGRAVELALRLALVACLALLPLLVGCASAGTPLQNVAAKANSTLESSAVLIAVGDTLDVRFADKSEWNQTIRVRPDGKASFIALPALAVEGMTVQDVERRLEEAYSNMLPQADITVGITTYGDRHVYVMGEVRDPGEIALEGRLTFLEALAQAGGPLKETALMKQVLLVRWNPRTRSQQTWRIDAREGRWGEGEPLFLQSYDVIFVPNTPIDDVDIWVDQYIRRLIPFPYLVAPAAGGGGA
jgi:protein involved in polysaccharide export with SLBB domain